MGTQSIQLSRKELDELRQSLQKRGIFVVEGNTQYELFRVKKEGYKCVAYTSGKLTFSTTYDLNNILDNKSPSQEDVRYEVFGGTDEAGKGEWFGPLVVALAMLTPAQIDESRRLGVKDSKLLSTPQIQKVAAKVLAGKFEHSIIVLSPPKYNKIYQEYQSTRRTLNDLLAESHAQVIEQYYQKYSQKRVQIIVDAFDEAKLTKRLTKPPPGWVIDQRTRGEQAIPVALASVLARARFLQEVQVLEQQHGITLFRTNPSDVPKHLLPKVAKMHFTNVQQALNP